MANVSITDLDGDMPGDVDVIEDGVLTRVINNYRDVDVIYSGGQTVVRMQNVWVLLKLLWHGGTADPTIEEVVSSNSIAAANVTLIYDGPPAGSWVMTVDFYASGPTRNQVTITPTVGNTLQQVAFSAYQTQGLPFDYMRVLFVTKNSGGTAVNPANGDSCWILFGPAI